MSGPLPDVYLFRHDEPPADQVRTMASSPKVMLTIAWNTDGSRIDILWKGATLETD
jgi:hypothetical protein